MHQQAGRVTGSAHVIRGDARNLPLPDSSVDLVVTSPPYFSLRSYRDNGEHYDGQIGSEATPAEFIEALLEVTRECVRVLKPSGSLYNTITVDVLQAIAVTLGYKTTRTDDGDRWVLYLTTGGRSLTLRGANGRFTPVGRERYTGTVWCPTTGTGTFVARRQGRVFITGNSFPTEWPRRIIQGWSPAGVCVACGEGRRPVVERQSDGRNRSTTAAKDPSWQAINRADWQENVTRLITGYACTCPEPTAPATPAVVLDPFGGTGTTALVAKVLGRHGIAVDKSADYCRLARWRTTDPGQLAKAARVEKPPTQVEGQADLLTLLDMEAT
jgi:site-specific DNA-methyltransferase (cytosine-N4-specific)